MDLKLLSTDQYLGHVTVQMFSCGEWAIVSGLNADHWVPCTICLRVMIFVIQKCKPFILNNTGSQTSWQWSTWVINTPFFFGNVWFYYSFSNLIHVTLLLLLHVAGDRSINKRQQWLLGISVIKSRTHTPPAPTTYGTIWNVNMMCTWTLSHLFTGHNE